MLFALRDYLAKAQYASLEQLTRVFSSDVTALLPMLEIWIERGVIKKENVTSSCMRTCTQGCVSKPSYYFYCFEK